MYICNQLHLSKLKKIVKSTEIKSTNINKKQYLKKK